MGRRQPTRAFLLPALILAVLVTAAQASGTVRATRQSGVAAGVVRAIDSFRSEQGLPRLRVSDELVAAARAHSLEMATRGYFSHRSADGSTFAQRVRHWYRFRPHWTTGENLVWGHPRLGGARVVQLWLASPPHRENLMDPSWRDVGCSAVHAAVAPGVFADESVTIVTCDFGARR